MRSPLAGTLAALTLLCGLAAGPAIAHPHVWITVQTTVLYDKAFTGLSHKWSFDQYYTAMAIEGLDKNKDGKYDREELAELAKVNIEGLKEFAYFTTASAAGKEAKFGEAKDYWLEYTDSVLSLHFVLPFEQSVPLKAKLLTFSVQDPAFFIAFDLAKTDPVKLAPGAPSACKIKIGGSPEQDNAAALDNAFAKQFGSVAVGAGSGVTVDCEGP